MNAVVLLIRRLSLLTCCLVYLIHSLARVSAAPMVLNPSFEENSALLWPGISPIVGWYGASDQVGLNPVLIYPNFGGAANIQHGDANHHSNNGKTPHGTNVALIHISPIGTLVTPQLGTMVAGFEAGKSYLLTYYDNARTGFGIPSVRVTLAGATIDSHMIYPVDDFHSWVNPYHKRQGLEFHTGDTAPRELMFTSSTPNNDATILLDMIRFVETGNLKVTGARRLYNNTKKVRVQFSAAFDLQTVQDPAHYLINDEEYQVAGAAAVSTNIVELTLFNSLPDSGGELRVIWVQDPDGKGIKDSYSKVQIRTHQLMPLELGASVNGFQDNFDESTRNPLWIPSGDHHEIFRQRRGVLNVQGSRTGASHLLLNLNGISDQNQEILARIQMIKPGAVGSRAGIASSVSAVSNEGLALAFVEATPTNSVELSDLPRQPSKPLGKSLGETTWYWMRLKHQPNTSPTAPDLLGKVWEANGDTEEPAAWTSWDYSGAQPLRQGLPGILAAVSGGELEFEIDYFLLLDPALPSITAELKSLPISLTIEKIGEQIHVTWPAVPETRDYRLQGRDAFQEDTRWYFLPLPTPLNNRYDFIDLGDAAVRFYRLVK